MAFHLPIPVFTPAGLLNSPSLRIQDLTLVAILFLKNWGFSGGKMHKFDFQMVFETPPHPSCLFNSLYIVACQGGGVSSKTTRRRQDTVLEPFSLN